jgi:hypothetical protein
MPVSLERFKVESEIFWGLIDPPENVEEPDTWPCYVCGRPALGSFCDIDCYSLYKYSNEPEDPREAGMIDYGY